MSAALIISTVIFLVILYSGYLNGLFSSVTTFLLLTIGIAFSMSFYTRLAQTRLCLPMGDYAESVCLVVLFVLGYFALQITANVFAPPIMHMKRMVNKLGGIGVSVGTAMLMTGFMGLVFYMTPWTGVHKGSEEFIGARLVARGFEHMTWATGGARFSADEFFKRLKKNECDRLCRRNLQNICIRLSENKELLSKDISDDNITCPCNDKPYVIEPLKSRHIPYHTKGKVVHAYDREPSHNLNGKPARMVLWTFRKRVGKSSNIKLTSKIELISEKKFQEKLQQQREKLGTGE